MTPQQRAHLLRQRAEIDAQLGMGTPGLPAQPAGQTGNVWYDQLQLTPNETARLNTWAAALGKELNWRLPLKGAIIEASIGALDFAQGGASRDAVLQFNFPMPAYITRITAQCRGFDSTLTPSDYFAGTGTPLDFVKLRLMRNNNETLTQTANGGDQYVTASAIAGDGRLPYNLDLVWAMWQSENLPVNVRFDDTITAIQGFSLQFHYMILPFGTVT